MRLSNVQQEVLRSPAGFARPGMSWSQALALAVELVIGVRRRSGPGYGRPGSASSHVSEYNTSALPHYQSNDRFSRPHVWADLAATRRVARTRRPAASQLADGTRGSGASAVGSGITALFPLSLLL